MAANYPTKVGIVWRGPAESRDSPVPQTSRLFPIFQALAAVGIAAVPAVYSEEASRAFREQLAELDGVLVWVDPLTGGRTRDGLDSILGEVSACGAWVSAHPDVILKMGTKEILYHTRDFGWGAETFLYRDHGQFVREFPGRLDGSRTRVLKQYRGNGGQGVWKVAMQTPASGIDGVVTLQEATHRDGTAIEMKLTDFMAQCAGYFSGAGRLIDQAFQPRVVEGMIRCYMSGSELVGFARQYPKGHAEGDIDHRSFGIPAEKTMYGPDAPQFQRLRQMLESEWIGQMQRRLEIDEQSLPALWDADFLFGAKTATGDDSYVLCEINVSCVTPFPNEAPNRIAATVQRALARHHRKDTIAWPSR
jgi:hypothetical protein